MPGYHFVTQWDLDAPVQETFEIIKDSSSLARWWPSVYLEVKTTFPGLANGIGKQVALLTKGYLPYTLRWNFEVTQIIPGQKIVIEATGDLTGKGVWTFETTTSGCLIRFDWNIKFNKPYLSWFGFILRPVFAFNHRWAMDKGLESLKLEVLRRKGIPGVPDPPLATFPHRREQKLQAV